MNYTHFLRHFGFFSFLLRAVRTVNDLPVPHHNPSWHTTGEKKKSRKYTHMTFLIVQPLQSSNQIIFSSVFLLMFSVNACDCTRLILPNTSTWIKKIKNMSAGACIYSAKGSTSIVALGATTVWDSLFLSWPRRIEQELSTTPKSTVSATGNQKETVVLQCHSKAVSSYPKLPLNYLNV